MTLVWGLVLMSFGFVKWGPVSSGADHCIASLREPAWPFLLGTLDRGANARGALAGMIAGWPSSYAYFDLRMWPLRGT